MCFVHVLCGLLCCVHHVLCCVVFTTCCVVLCLLVLFCVVHIHTHHHMDCTPEQLVTAHVRIRQKQLDVPRAEHWLEPAHMLRIEL